MLLREIGLQARLWCLLIEKLDPKVVMSEVLPKGHARYQHTRDFKTSRIQLESKVGGPKKCDIVVLRKGKNLQITCWPGGPTDVVAAIKPSDVEAVIEMKASPSRDPKNRRAFVADIRKLDDLRAKHRHLQCYFVLY